MIDFTIEGVADLIPYNSLVNQIKQFNDYSIIGEDSSGLYDVYKIELGVKGKPIILLMASMHGTEYQASICLINLLRDLEKNERVNTSFRKRLIDNYHIIAFPCINPYGFDNTTRYAVTKGRHGFTGQDINNDFHKTKFNIIESVNLRPYLDNKKTIAFVDQHLQRNLNPETADIAPSIAHPVQNYMLNNIVGKLSEQFPNKTIGRRLATHWNYSGRIRAYMSFHKNIYTEQTLGFSGEIGRPVQESDGFYEPNTNREIFTIGYSMYYYSIVEIMNYFDLKNGTSDIEVDDEAISKVNSPIKDISYMRDNNGLISSISEYVKKGQYKNKTIKTKINRDKFGKMVSYERELED